MDRQREQADADVVSDTIEVQAGGGSAKRLRRTAEEKRRIVEATLVPGASIARVARAWSKCQPGVSVAA
jgi:transposase-like protein